MDADKTHLQRGGGCYITLYHASHVRHGHWVRHRRTGQVGRIGCELPADGRVAAVWEESGRWHRHHENYGWYRPEELEELPEREPRPWYERQAILRRRPDGRDDDLWWEDRPQVKW